MRKYCFLTFSGNYSELFFVISDAKTKKKYQRKYDKLSLNPHCVHNHGYTPNDQLATQNSLGFLFFTASPSKEGLAIMIHRKNASTPEMFPRASLKKTAVH